MLILLLRLLLLLLLLLIFAIATSAVVVMFLLLLLIAVLWFPQPRPAAAESAGAQTSDNPLRSNRNVRIRVDPQGGVAITSIIASLGRSGEAPTQNAQATQGVQTTTTTSGTRHSGDNGNGSRETFSSSFGNQRSSVSSGGAGTGTPAVGGGEAGETSDNPPPPPGSRTTRIIVDDFIALVSSIAPSPFTPTPPSASATPSSTAQGGPQGAGRGGGQSPAGAARFQLFNPTPPAAPPNHPDPTLPCQSFHFGPQSSQPRAQPDGSRDPASANTGGPAAAQSSSVASGPSPSAQRAGTTRGEDIESLGTQCDPDDCCNLCPPCSVFWSRCRLLSLSPSRGCQRVISPTVLRSRLPLSSSK